MMIKEKANMRRRRRKMKITGLHDLSFLCSFTSIILYSLPNVHIISIVSNIRLNNVNNLLGYRHHNIYPTLRQAL
jgi:hypothetical protein